MTNTSECFISVIAPLYNDLQIVEAFVAEIMQVLREHYTYYELVLVNDGSEDDTAEKVTILLNEYECIRLINLSRHFGTEVVRIQVRLPNQAFSSKLAA